MKLFTFKMLIPAVPFAIEYKVTIARNCIKTAFKKAIGEIAIHFPDLDVAKTMKHLKYELIETRDIK